MALGGDGQSAVLQVDMDVFLLKAGQIRFQYESVAVIPDVGLKGFQRIVAEEVPFQLFHFTERIKGCHAVCSLYIRCHKHNKTLQ